MSQSCKIQLRQRRVPILHRQHGHDESPPFRRQVIELELAKEESSPPSSKLRGQPQTMGPRRATAMDGESTSIRPPAIFRCGISCQISAATRPPAARANTRRFILGAKFQPNEIKLRPYQRSAGETRAKPSGIRSALNHSLISASYEAARSSRQLQRPASTSSSRTTSPATSEPKTLEICG